MSTDSTTSASSSSAEHNHGDTAPLSRDDRPSIVGPDSPTAPYPIYLQGCVQKGFGRGSKELGIPTANLPDASIEPLTSLGLRGVYYGYARVLANPTSGLQSSSLSGIATPGTKLEDGDLDVHPMVMSVGWNPYYKNERLTAVHVMHEYASDFYSHEIFVVVLGYIRPELNYVSKEALIEDINTDKQVALNSLQRPDYAAIASHPFLLEPASSPAAAAAASAADGLASRGAGGLGKQPLGRSKLAEEI